MKYLANIGDDFFGFIHPLAVPSGIGTSVTLILNIAFVGAGLILLFFIVLGGIGIISSAGGGDPGKIEKSKQTVSSALIGFIVVFAAYWIVKLIGQITGITDILGS